VSDTDIPYFWSAGSGKGWPQTEVLAALRGRIGFPEQRSAMLWRVGEPFPRNSSGPDPVIVTCDPLKATILAMTDRDWIYIPSIMPEPVEPPEGYEVRYGSTGDPWLLGYD
jgi:hypothetical protein